jgi:uracil-DNA glycosylase family 4
VLDTRAASWRVLNGARRSERGAERNRTAVRGFAGPCLTSRPRRRRREWYPRFRGTQRRDGTAEPARRERGAVRSRTAEPDEASRGSRGLQGLPALEDRHPDGVRRGLDEGGGHVRREQPGDQEDKLGQPFVGPAGRLLDQALVAAGIDRSRTYVTNVVKHFKWQARGKRRIHQKPSWSEVTACRPWLDAELRVVKPRVLVSPGRHCGSGASRPAVPGHAEPRRARRFGARSRRDRHGSPLVHPAVRRPRDRARRIRQRPEDGRGTPLVAAGQAPFPCEDDSRDA